MIYNQSRCDTGMYFSSPSRWRVGPKSRSPRNGKRWMVTAGRETGPFAGDQRGQLGWKFPGCGDSTSTHYYSLGLGIPRILLPLSNPLIKREATTTGRAHAQIQGVPQAADRWAPCAPTCIHCDLADRLAYVTSGRFRPARAIDRGCRERLNGRITALDFSSRRSAA